MVLKTILSYYNVATGDSSIPPNHLYWLCVPIVLVLADQYEVASMQDQQAILIDAVECFFALVDYHFNPINDGVSSPANVSDSIASMLGVLQALLSEHAPELLAHLKRLASPKSTTGNDERVHIAFC